MTKVLITGANGFIGKNLTIYLQQRQIEVLTYDKSLNEYSDLVNFIHNADFIVHLAGINRPNDKQIFEENVECTKEVINLVKNENRVIPIIYSSTIQAIYDNDYGKSKKRAEDILFDFQNKNNNPVYVFRLHNVFGKWSRPNYNSVVATFSYNAARDIPIVVDDLDKEITFVYIDDVCQLFYEIIANKTNMNSKSILYASPLYPIKLGQLKTYLESFKNYNSTHELQSLSDPFVYKLYATYISYIPLCNLKNKVDIKCDSRGFFAELFKSIGYGQISINVTKPHEVKGGHYHDSKCEKFIVLSGKGRLLLQNVLTKEDVTYQLSDDELSIVDIPPGCSHLLENISDSPLVTLMWASEKYVEANPDTFKKE